MRKIFILIIAMTIGVVSFAQDTSKSIGPKPEKAGKEPLSRIVTMIKLQGAIGPVTTREIINAISRSTRMDAQALVIELNTPGGEMEATWDIIQDILASNVPVVVYVYPPGSRAASAGVYITYASHIAAMAPQTNIGSAHPVGMGGANIDSTLNEKITNDAVAKIKTLAAKRHRNANWAENAVRKSVSITEFEAKDSSVVNLVASDLEDLLAKIDGDTVETITGIKVLHTADAQVKELTIGFADQVLHIISDPNIAYILMAIGMLGLYFEFANPGAILPGVIGGISLILALFSFQALPIRFAGVLLIILAMVLFLLEVKLSSHGVLGGGGVLSLFFGSLMLVNDTEFPYKGISLSVIIPTVLVFTVFFFLAAYLALRTHKRKVTTGEAGLVGEVGISKSKVNSDGGNVYVHGALWKAVSDVAIEDGKHIRVVEVSGMQLKVEQI
jgi:membrane-bound serine protease (ClpP class)